MKLSKPITFVGGVVLGIVISAFVEKPIKDAVDKVKETLKPKS